MKRRCWRTVLTIIVVVSAFVLPGLAHAETYGRKLGLGLMLGNPLGGNIKGWVSDTQAIDGGIGLGFLGGEHLQVHATYLWHFAAVSEPSVDMDFYTRMSHTYRSRQKVILSHFAS